MHFLRFVGLDRLLLRLHLDTRRFFEERRRRLLLGRRIDLREDLERRREDLERRREERRREDFERRTRRIFLPERERERDADRERERDADRERERERDLRVPRYGASLRSWKLSLDVNLVRLASP